MSGILDNPRFGGPRVTWDNLLRHTGSDLFHFYVEGEAVAGRAAALRVRKLCLEPMWFIVAFAKRSVGRVQRVLRTVHWQWRERQFEEVRSLKGKHLGKPKVPIAPKSDPYDFSAMDIWESVFKPALKMRGNSNWFLYLQHEYYHDPRKSGSW